MVSPHVRCRLPRGCTRRGCARRSPRATASASRAFPVTGQAAPCAPAARRAALRSARFVIAPVPDTALPFVIGVIGDMAGHAAARAARSRSAASSVSIATTSIASRRARRAAHDRRAPRAGATSISSPPTPDRRRAAGDVLPGRQAGACGRFRRRGAHRGLVAVSPALYRRVLVALLDRDRRFRAHGQRRAAARQDRCRGPRGTGAVHLRRRPRTKRRSRPGGAAPPRRIALSRMGGSRRRTRPGAGGRHQSSVSRGAAFAVVVDQVGWCAGFDGTRLARSIESHGLGALLCATRIAQTAVHIIAEPCSGAGNARAARGVPQPLACALRGITKGDAGDVVRAARPLRGGAIELGDAVDGFAPIVSLDLAYQAEASRAAIHIAATAGLQSPSP